jgi:hypothetical protein
MSDTFFAVTVTSQDGTCHIATVAVFASDASTAERRALEEVARDETATSAALAEQGQGDPFEFSADDFGVTDVQEIRLTVGVKLVEARG